MTITERNELFMSMYPYIRNLVSEYIRSADYPWRYDYEDLVQDASIRILRDLPHWDAQQSTLPTFVHPRIAWGILDSTRGRTYAKKTFHFTETTDPLDSIWDTLVSENTLSTEDKLTYEVVVKHFDFLPPRMQYIMKQKHIKGRTLTALSIEGNCTQGGVSHLYAIAIRKLRESLGDDEVGSAS